MVKNKQNKILCCKDNYVSADIVILILYKIKNLKIQRDIMSANKEMEIKQLVEKQRQFFQSGMTLDVSYRIEALKKLKAAVYQYENEINDALEADLGKSNFESYICEIGMVLSEISHMLKHIRSYAKDKRVPTPLAQFPSKSFQRAMPYGVTLIMSPWNYPLLLTLGPMVDAIAAGNTVIVKPSAYSAKTSQVIQKMLTETFQEEYIAVVTGGREENNYLLEEKFDYIFFTGSKGVGELVLEKAAKHLTPVTLELGGKSPCIIDKSANLKVAARSVVFGKYLNCGQTCVAPDYVLCHKDVKDEFLTYVKDEIKLQYGEDYLKNADYGKIINEKHYRRIKGLIATEKIYFGGKYDDALLKIEPTVLDHVTWQDAVMQEEIFGPVMPILTYENIDEVIQSVNSYDKPLALYVFAENKAVREKITERCVFGGGCVNDTIIHLATTAMGFGGVGESGMGAYHGKTGFDTFSHYKSIVDKKTWLDLPMRYQPYQKSKERMVRFFLK